MSGGEARQTSQQSAAAITKASKSNLALAFIALPRQRRRDMTTFYAFCRVVDDIADSRELSEADKQRRLQLWREALADHFAGEPPLAQSVRDLIRRYMIPPSYFEDILRGVEMDIAPRYFKNFEELQKYCYHVAGAVGLVSIEIFGYKNLVCKDYAVDLGLALQLTNILRDVGEDCANGGRVYLPLEDLAQFDYSPEDIALRRYDSRFLGLMDFESEQAIYFYEKASAELPSEDRGSMIAAEIMRVIYRRLLEKMRRDRFHVFEKRYSLGGAQKMLTVAEVIFATLMRMPIQDIR